MFDRISRSWTLAGQCWDVLKGDPALLIFPLLSALVMILLLGSFALPILMVHHALPAYLTSNSIDHSGRAASFLAIYVFYVVSYSVVMFFNSALIAVALRRLDGESASVGEGLQIALANLPAILGYALIAASVGTLLRVIEERVGLIGRIVVAIVGATWTLATSMTLPVLVAENVGPVEAISRSLELLRRNWGENLIGNGGISLGLSVIMAPLLLLAILFFIFALSSKALGAMILAGTIMVLALIGSSLVSATLHAIYTAALYRFATGEKDNGGIAGAVLAGAFRQK
jgi:hypothetical protein